MQVEFGAEVKGPTPAPKKVGDVSFGDLLKKWFSEQSVVSEVKGGFEQIGTNTSEIKKQTSGIKSDWEELKELSKDGMIKKTKVRVPKQQNQGKSGFEVKMKRPDMKVVWGDVSGIMKGGFSQILDLFKITTTTPSFPSGGNSGGGIFTERTGEIYKPEGFSIGRILDKIKSQTGEYNPMILSFASPAETQKIQASIGGDLQTTVSESRENEVREGVLASSESTVSVSIELHEPFAEPLEEEPETPEDVSTPPDVDEDYYHFDLEEYHKLRGFYYLYAMGTIGDLDNSSTAHTRERIQRYDHVLKMHGEASIARAHLTKTVQEHTKVPTPLPVITVLPVRAAATDENGQDTAQKHGAGYTDLYKNTMDGIRKADADAVERSRTSSYSPFESKFQRVPGGLLGTEYEKLLISGADYIPNHYTAAFYWNTLLPEGAPKLPNGLAVRMTSIQVPQLKNTGFQLMSASHAIEKIKSTHDITRKSSFTFRLDDKNSWLTLFGELIGERLDPTHHLVAMCQSAFSHSDSHLMLVAGLSNIGPAYIEKNADTNSSDGPRFYRILIFEDVKIIGTENLKFTSGGGIQEMSVDFIYKRLHIKRTGQEVDRRLQGGGYVLGENHAVLKDGAGSGLSTAPAPMMTGGK